MEENLASRKSAYGVVAHPTPPAAPGRAGCQERGQAIIREVVKILIDFKVRLKQGILGGGSRAGRRKASGPGWGVGVGGAVARNHPPSRK